MAVLVAAANLAWLLVDKPGYVAFLAAHVAPDHVITSFEVVYPVFLAAYCLVALSWLVLAGRRSLADLQSLLDLHLRGADLACVSLIAAAMFTHVVLGRLLPLGREDDFLEWLSVGLALSAAGLYCVAAFRHRHWGRVLILLLATAAFVYAMEEISWGQRLFGWSTPAALRAVNQQRETNLHNVANRYFPILYAAANLVLGVLLVRTEELRLRLPRLMALAEPLSAPSADPGVALTLLGYILLILVTQGLFRGGELSETVWGLLALSHSAMLCWRPRDPCANAAQAT